jgi:broad specificity phosphatase PhoE
MNRRRPNTTEGHSTIVTTRETERHETRNREPSSSTRITLIRHGHVHNPGNIIYGRLPGFGLSDMGRRQAEAAALHLKATQLSRLFTSPQQRAAETAEIVCRHHDDLDPKLTPLMDETDCFFEGHPAEEVEARGWDLYTGVVGNFETPEDIAERGARFITECRLAYAHAHTAVVTHGDVIAFTVLHAMRDVVHVSRKRTLAQYGIHDAYPATASLTTLIYNSTDPDEVPSITYVRPYGAELTLTSLL